MVPTTERATPSCRMRCLHATVALPLFVAHACAKKMLHDYLLHFPKSSEAGHHSSIRKAWRQGRQASRPMPSSNPQCRSSEFLGGLHQHGRSYPMTPLQRPFVELTMRAVRPSSPSRCFGQVCLLSGCDDDRGSSTTLVCNQFLQPTGAKSRSPTIPLKDPRILSL